MKRVLLLFVLLLLLLAACGKEAPAETAAPTQTAAATNTPAPTETPEPVETNNEWLEEIPWEEPWACLILGSYELEPEAGKEGLRTLFSSYDWQLTDTPEKWQEPVGFAFKGVVYPAEGEGLAFWLTREGEVYWNGCLYAPLGDDLWERWTALRETGEYLYAPPRLGLVSGASTVAAFNDGSYSWTHTDRLGHVYPVISDGFRDYRETDWFSLEWAEVLYAEGEVALSFAGREPDSMHLFLFSSMGDLTLDLREGRFTPMPGRNAYALRCTWEQKPGGCGTVLYLLLLDAPEDLTGEKAREDLRLAVTQADRWCCALTLENDTTRPFSPEEADLLRRNAAGGWDWVKPIRPKSLSIPARSSLIMPGKSTDFSWDWSCVCGPLEAGEYCLRLRGSLGYAARTEPAVLLGYFTLTGEEADFPGPLSLCETPEGLESAMEAVSPHRWVQTITLKGDWGVSSNGYLFRLSEDEELTFIPPAYRQQDRASWDRLLRWDTAVDLAVQYGALDAGTYVLRRQVLRYTPEETANNIDFESWLEVPGERLENLDTVFTLTSPLSAVPLPVSGTEESWWGPCYNGEGSVLPVSFAGSEFSPWNAELRMEGQDYGQAIQSQEFTLYFQYEGEWFPLAQTKPWAVDRRAFCLLPAGETAGLHISLSGPFGELPPGLYRLILRSTVDSEDIDKAPAPGGPLVCQFRINEDGTGELVELTPEAP